MQNVLIGENLGGYASICMGRIVYFNVFVVNKLRFWTHKVYCIY